MLSFIDGINIIHRLFILINSFLIIVYLLLYLNAPWTQVVYRLYLYVYLHISNSLIVNHKPESIPKWMVNCVTMVLMLRFLQAIKVGDSCAQPSDFTRRFLWPIYLNDASVGDKVTNESTIVRVPVSLFFQLSNIGTRWLYWSRNDIIQWISLVQSQIVLERERRIVQVQ